MARTHNRFILTGTALAAVAAFALGTQWRGDQPVALINEASASGGGTVQEGWSPTGVYPNQEVYYPGTEALAEDEIRVIACGSGMPMPRLKQAAACFLIETGNGEKFIFDLGTGSFTTLRPRALRPIDGPG